ncbi:MAG TPA: hypothetical protein VH416_08680 [Gaiellaceae bacterium]
MRTTIALGLAFALVTVALVAASPAAAARRVVDRGLIFRVRPFAIVLEELDGTRARIKVGPRTLVLVDGQPATLGDLRRGEVAIVVHFGRRPAAQIRAFTSR